MRACPREPNPGEIISASWMREFVRFVRATRPLPGPGMLTKETPNGTFISPTAGTARSSTSEGISPFTVRYVTNSDSESPWYDPGCPYEGFEIYLPLGCMNVGRTAKPLNLEAAREIDGRIQVIPGWYRLKDPDGETSNANYEVEVHVKASAAENGVDEFASWPKCYMWAEAHDQNREQEDADEDPSAAGDTFAMTVARILYLGGDMTIEQDPHPAVSMEHSPRDEFELLWVFEVDQSDGQSIEITKMYVRNQSFAAAGVTFTSDTITEVDVGASTINLKIDTSTDPYTATVDSVTPNGQQSEDDGTLVPDEESEEESPYIITVRLYRLNKGKVLTDDRRSLANIQVYKA